MKKRPYTHSSLGGLLKPLLNRIPLAIRTVGELRLHWEGFLGKGYAKHSRPAFYDEKTKKLTIYTDSTIWNAELTAQAGEILKAIPKKYNVEGLRCILQKNWTPYKEPEPVPAPQSIKLKEAEIQKIKKQVAKQQFPPELAEAVEQFLIICTARNSRD